jgi:hypothetical protein
MWELLKKYRKNELNIYFEQYSPWDHTELDLDVLGVHGKLVKYVV